MASDSRTSGSSGGSALLLRLFESDFFNVHLAVEYLKLYPQSIGITHYLVNRLRSFDAAEVEFYWPQLCYLVITGATPSVALENFILERCEQDPHVAVVTLWYLQSSLSDLFAKPTSDHFTICHRIYNRVQSIIFTDPPIPSSPPPAISPIPTPSPSTVSLPTSSKLSVASAAKWALALRPKEKVNAPVASFVGMGVMWGGIGQPRLTKDIGPMAIEQGRRIEKPTKGGEQDDDDDAGGENNSGSDEDPTSPKVGSKAGKGKVPKVAVNGRPTAAATAKSLLRGGGKPKRSQTQPISYLPGPRLEPTPPPVGLGVSSSTASSGLGVSIAPQHSMSMSFLPSASGDSTFARQQRQKYDKGSPTSSNGTTSPSMSPVLGSKRKGPARIAHSNAPVSLSVPSLPLPHPSSSSSLTGSSLPFYGLPKPFLSHLLVLQSCRTQLDLLRSLQDISTRLVIVPKLARLSSLRAELTVLNHGLPRGCCLGMACKGTPFPHSHSQKSESKTEGPRAHARIVRISPSESVVLNSADRAPFVIHVEVLEDDLDFDPDRRQNAEDVRRALMEREGGARAGGWGDLRGNGRNTSGVNGRKSLESGLDGLAEKNGSKEGLAAPSRTSLSRRSSSRSAIYGEDPGSPGGDLSGSWSRNPMAAEEEVEILTPPRIAEPEGEMDLVEQLYGDISIRDEPEPKEDDTPIQNRSVDEQAWARMSGGSRPESTRTSQEAPRHSLSLSSRSAPPPASGAKPGGRSVSNRPAISLDDYAERMRMAAIMLAQLDASQAASLGVVATGTAAAGTLVGLPVATVAGIGGVVGAGLGAVASRLRSRDVQPGQGSAGVAAALDTSSAAAGTSSVAGAPPLASSTSHPPPHLANPLASSTSSNSSATAPLPPSQRPRLLGQTEATAIRNRIMSEMMALEEERMERMREDGRARAKWSATNGVEDGAVVMRAVNKEDPSGAVFAESFASKKARIRAASPYGHLSSWNVISVIVKTGADLRQEQLAIQLIRVFGQIWKEEKCPSWVRYFRILVTSETSGLIETITDAVSVHSIKKDAYARTAADGTQVFDSFTLYDHYVETFGQPSTPAFRKAQANFIKSLASYSVICYLLQLKDRHNGNILVDRDGHLIHIDFGFLLSNSPGSLGFEMAPFKLPQDYIDILGGFESDMFADFKKLFKQAFRDARKHAERIITLVELMQKDSNLPCFANGDLTSQQLRERFVLSLTQSQVEDFAEKLIINAATSTFTRLYDLFQGYSNGIL